MNEDKKKVEVKENNRKFDKKDLETIIDLINQNLI